MFLVVSHLLELLKKQVSLSCRDTIKFIEMLVALHY